MRAANSLNASPPITSSTPPSACSCSPPAITRNPASFSSRRTSVSTAGSMPAARTSARWRARRPAPPGTGRRRPASFAPRRRDGLDLVAADEPAAHLADARADLVRQLHGQVADLGGLVPLDEHAVDERRLGADDLRGDNVCLPTANALPVTSSPPTSLPIFVACSGLTRPVRFNSCSWSVTGERRSLDEREALLARQRRGQDLGDLLSEFRRPRRRSRSRARRPSANERRREPAAAGGWRRGGGRGRRGARAAVVAVVAGTGRWRASGGSSAVSGGVQDVSDSAAAPARDVLRGAGSAAASGRARRGEVLDLPVSASAGSAGRGSISPAESGTARRGPFRSSSWTTSASIGAARSSFTSAGHHAVRAPARRRGAGRRTARSRPRQPRRQSCGSSAAKSGCVARQDSLGGDLAGHDW